MPAYTLECSLERESIRTFRSMLMCLKQFGTDLFFEANERTVTLRTLNTAQSAFIVCTLQSAFFAKYTVRAWRGVSSSSSPRLTPFPPRLSQFAPGASASVKLHLKNLTSIFRSTFGVERVWLQVAAGGEQATEGCEAADAYMRVQLMCASGLRKKFDLAFQEVTSINAVYDRTVCPHRLKADPAIMLDCLKNFPSTLAEVTMVAGPQALTLKNEIEVATDDLPGGPGTNQGADGGGGRTSGGGDDQRQTVRTEMRLQACDLHEYVLGPSAPPAGVSVAFSQREFKALLSLLREVDHVLTCHIEGGGRPIIFGSSVRGEVLTPFAIDCVLATVVETDLGDDDMFDLGPADGSAPPPSNQQHMPPHMPPHQQHMPYQQHMPPQHPSQMQYDAGPSSSFQYSHQPGGSFHYSQQPHYAPPAGSYSEATYNPHAGSQPMHPPPPMHYPPGAPSSHPPASWGHPAAPPPAWGHMSQPAAATAPPPNQAWAPNHSWSGAPPPRGAVNSLAANGSWCVPPTPQAHDGPAAAHGGTWDAAEGGGARSPVRARAGGGDNSDTEEDDDCVPGTPPDQPPPDWPNKQARY